MAATEYRDVVYWAIMRAESETVLDTYIEPCLGGTDIYWMAYDLPTGVRGEWTCIITISSTWCDSANIVMDFPEIDVGGDDCYDRRKNGHA